MLHQWHGQKIALIYHCWTKPFCLTNKLAKAFRISKIFHITRVIECCIIWKLHSLGKQISDQDLSVKFLFLEIKVTLDLYFNYLPHSLHKTMVLLIYKFFGTTGVIFPFKYLWTCKCYTCCPRDVKSKLKCWKWLQFSSKSMEY